MTFAVDYDELAPRTRADSGAAYIGNCGAKAVF